MTLEDTVRVVAGLHVRYPSARITKQTYAAYHEDLGGFTVDDVLAAAREWMDTDEGSRFFPPSPWLRRALTGGDADGAAHAAWRKVVDAFGTGSIRELSTTALAAVTEVWGYRRAPADERYALDAHRNRHPFLEAYRHLHREQRRAEHRDAVATLMVDARDPVGMLSGPTGEGLE